jgi:hypothetical protein
MAFLGRESEADLRRAERFRAWFQTRTPYALPSAALGALAMLEAFTLVPIFGLAAIGLGIAGLRDLARRPNLSGRRMCFAGIGLGVAGLALHVTWSLIYPALAHSG